MAIILHRHRNHGLLLSELGGYLLWAEERGAGTKRISNLIRTNKWNAGLIEEFLWQEGTQRGNSYIGSYGLVTTRGEQSSQKRTEEILVLAHIDQLWGKQVLHIWDRGFAGNHWLTCAFCLALAEQLPLVG